MMVAKVWPFGWVVNTPPSHTSLPEFDSQLQPLIPASVNTNFGGSSEGQKAQNSQIDLPF